MKGTDVSLPNATDTSFNIHSLLNVAPFQRPSLPKYLAMSNLTHHHDRPSS